MLYFNIRARGVCTLCTWCSVVPAPSVHGAVWCLHPLYMVQCGACMHAQYMVHACSVYGAV